MLHEHRILMVAEHHQSLDLSIVPFCNVDCCAGWILPDQVEVCLPLLGLGPQHSRGPFEPVAIPLTVSASVRCTLAKASNWQAVAICCSLHTVATVCRLHMTADMKAANYGY